MKVQEELIIFIQKIQEKESFTKRDISVKLVNCTTVHMK